MTCAGENGCHGNRDSTNEWTAVSGGHHGDDTVLKFGTINTSAQGVSVPTSYRFLYGVHGAENTSWYNTSANNHNEYSGVDMSVRSSQSSVTTISQLCAECHGDFHASAEITNQVAATWGPWLRHPTDYVLPNTGEYASITTTWDKTAIVGRTDTNLDLLSAPDPTIDKSADVVTCISCHQAHGTDYPDILRWDYTNTLSAGTGCLYCHTGKLAY